MPRDRRPGVPAPGWGAAFDPTKTQQLGNLPPGTSVGALGVFTIAPDFKNPHTDKITLGAEREFFGIAWGIDATWAKGYNLERLNDANLRRRAGRELPATRPEFRFGLLRRLADVRRAEPDQLELRVPQGLHVGRSLGLQGRHAVLPEELRGGIPVLRLADPRLRLRHRLERAQLFRLLPLGRQQPRAELGTLRPRHPVARRGECLVRAQLREGQHVLLGSLQLPDGPALQRVPSADVNKDANFTDRATIDGVVTGRNAFRQPDFYTVDLRLGVGYKLGPGTLALFLDIFNLTNTGNRSTSLTNYPGSGTTTFGTLNGFTTTPRTLQFSGRYDF